MITENGSIKVTTVMNEKVQKEFSKGTFITALVLTILGAIGVVVFLVLDLVAIFLELESMDYFTFIIVFAVFLGCGIGILVVVNKAVNTARSTNKTYTYEFYKDYFIANETFNGETVATVKIFNGQVLKSRETKNYLFFYTNTVSACPVEKAGLSEGELNTLRNIFRLPVKGGMVELSQEILPSSNEDKGAETVSSPNEIGEPFDEFKN